MPTTTDDRTSGSREEIARTRDELRALHRDGLTLLAPEVVTALTRLQPIYPLSTTAPHLDEIRRFATESRFTSIIGRWHLLEWAVEQALAYVPRSAVGRTMVHTDVHPRNVLYAANRALLIDFDNVLIDRPFKCLGFSILRFAFMVGDRKASPLESRLEAWLVLAELADRAFVADLVHGMLFLEAEKSVRILYRYLRTGSYSDFVDNVSKIHLANLEMITPLWRQWCT